MKVKRESKNIRDRKPGTEDDRKKQESGSGSETGMGEEGPGEMTVITCTAKEVTSAQHPKKTGRRIFCPPTSSISNNNALASHSLEMTTTPSIHPHY